jgi:pentapeptide repeat protein
MGSSLNLRSPAVLTAIGISATLVLALIVIITLLQTGGAKAVSDNAAVIGALVALGGVFTAQMVSIALDDRRTQEARNLEAQRAGEAALQNYFEVVGELLIEKQLRRASPGDNLSTVVRAQTLSVFEGLDAERKRILLLFLYEAGLIYKDKPVVSLEAANLSHANLRGADLSGTALHGADMNNADLSCIVEETELGPIMSCANLSGTNLSKA